MSAAADREKGAEVLGLGALWVVMLAPLAMLHAYVLRTLWGWFLVSDFAFPALSWHAALGLSLIVRYLTATTATPADNRTASEVLAAAIGRGIAYPLLALGFGFLYHTVTS